MDRYQRLQTEIWRTRTPSRANTGVHLRSHCVSRVGSYRTGSPRRAACPTRRKTSSGQCRWLTLGVIPTALEQFRFEGKTQALSITWRNPIGSDQVPLVSEAVQYNMFLIFC